MCYSQYLTLPDLSITAIFQLIKMHLAVLAFILSILIPTASHKLVMYLEIQEFKIFYCSAYFYVIWRIFQLLYWKWKQRFRCRRVALWGANKRTESDRNRILASVGFFGRPIRHRWPPLWGSLGYLLGVILVSLGLPLGFLWVHRGLHLGASGPVCLCFSVCGLVCVSVCVLVC